MPRRSHNYYIYIMASINKVIYVGVTNDLIRRGYQHIRGTYGGFTKKYKCHKLVYYEHFDFIQDAIKREKELKGWKREKKIKLIENNNLEWSDLYPDLVEFSKTAGFRSFKRSWR